MEPSRERSKWQQQLEVKGRKTKKLGIIQSSSMSRGRFNSKGKESLSVGIDDQDLSLEVVREERREKNLSKQVTMDMSRAKCLFLNLRALWVSFHFNSLKSIESDKSLHIGRFNLFAHLFARPRLADLNANFIFLSHSLSTNTICSMFCEY